MVTDKQERKKENFELSESQKYKLTLGIDREVIRRAKMADINISFWTEQFLKIMTFREEEIKVSHEDVLQSWYTFLLEVKRILVKYGIEGVVLGEWDLYESSKKPNSVGRKVGSTQFTLSSSGHMYEYEYDLDDMPLDFEESLALHGQSEIKEAPMLSIETVKNYLRRGSFAKPTEIITNLLEVITQSSNMNKEKVKEMQQSLRILRILFENNVNNENGGNKK